MHDDTLNPGRGSAQFNFGANNFVLHDDTFNPGRGSTMFNFRATNFVVHDDVFNPGRGSTQFNFRATNFVMHDDTQEARQKNHERGMATKQGSRRLRLLRGEQLLLRRVPRGENRQLSGPDCGGWLRKGGH